MHKLLEQNTELTREMNKLICHAENKGTSPLP